MTITVAMVKELREISGAGMMVELIVVMAARLGNVRRLSLAATYSLRSSSSSSARRAMAIELALA